MGGDGPSGFVVSALRMTMGDRRVFVSGMSRLWVGPYPKRTAVLGGERESRLACCSGFRDRETRRVRIELQCRVGRRSTTRMGRTKHYCEPKARYRMPGHDWVGFPSSWSAMIAGRDGCAEESMVGEHVDHVVGVVNTGVFAESRRSRYEIWPSAMMTRERQYRTVVIAWDWHRHRRRRGKAGPTGEELRATPSKTCYCYMPDAPEDDNDRRRKTGDGRVDNRGRRVALAADNQPGVFVLVGRWLLSVNCGLSGVERRAASVVWSSVEIEVRLGESSGSARRRKKIQ